MAILKPDGGEQPESRNGFPRTISRIGSAIWEGIRRLFSVQVPKHIQEQGLSQKDYNYIERRFHEIMKGTLRSEEEKILEQSATPMSDLLFAHGWHADGERRDRVLAQLIGEFDLRDKPEVVAFLKDQLTPLPRGVSWQK